MESFREHLTKDLLMIYNTKMALSRCSLIPITCEFQLNTFSFLFQYREMCVMLVISYTLQVQIIQNTRVFLKESRGSRKCEAKYQVSQDQMLKPNFQLHH